MPQLPDRPDLDQLRRQARELLRAAQGGDPAALRRLRPVSDKVTLSTAQLALAREYGFPSWSRLAGEAERRRAALEDPERSAPGPAVPAAAEVAAGGDGVVGRLTADAGELIAGQYADRPQLRPVLDAVLAALPPLGPVTGRPARPGRLVSPRRTFAVVQATTKNRVDLGLRLDNAEPGGRLQAARDIGAANLRIPLTGPGDLDEEALGWLRRAYDENAAPPPPRRPARRPAAVLGQLTVVIEGYDLPGLTCQPDPTVPAIATFTSRCPARARTGLPWPCLAGRAGHRTRARRCRVRALGGPGHRAARRGRLRLHRPFVGGTRDDRSLGLAWGDVPGDGTLRLFRGAKLRLVDVALA